MGKIPYYRLLVTLKTSERIAVNGFWGAHLRSALGISLRESCCPFPGADCTACLLRHDCAFSVAWYSFVRDGEAGETAPPGVTTNYPHPFIIRPSLGIPDTIEAGRLLSFELVLLGSQILKLPYWIVALKRMAERGLRKRGRPLQLKQVKRICGKRPMVLYEDGFESVKLPTRPSHIDIGDAAMEKPGEEAGDITISFATPVRLRIKGVEPVKPTPNLLWHSLRRRLRLISSALCGHDFEVPNAIQYSDDGIGRWTPIDGDRWSSTQQQRIPVSGYVGEVKLEGIPLNHIRLWSIGSMLGIGKMCSFGLGAYSVGETIRSV